MAVQRRPGQMKATYTQREETEPMARIAGGEEVGPELTRKTVTRKPTVETGGIPSRAKAVMAATGPSRRGSQPQPVAGRGGRGRPLAPAVTPSFGSSRDWGGR